MEDQIKELVACAKSLTRELKQLKEAKVERRIRKNEEKKTQGGGEGGAGGDRRGDEGGLGN